MKVHSKRYFNIAQICCMSYQSEKSLTVIAARAMQWLQCNLYSAVAVPIIQGSVEVTAYILGKQRKVLDIKVGMNI